MSIFESIVKQLNEHSEQVASNTEGLIPYLAEAAHLAAHSILQDKKILTIAGHQCQAINLQFCLNLLGEMNLERPSLPVINLACQHQHDDSYAKHIQAIGSAEDLLIVFSQNGEESYLAGAIEAAKACQMQVILLSAQKDYLAKLLNDDMVNIFFPQTDCHQIISLQFVITQLLSELIEQQLFSGLS